VLRVGRVTARVDRGKAQRLGTDYAVVLVTDMTRRILNRGTVMTPVDTGNLRAHNKMRVARMPPGARGEVYNDADYAAAVHNGSGPYTIRPRRKKVLRFVAGGRVVFAQSVRHPGTRARPWLARAAEQVARQEGWTWSPAR
jgi:hypothetical protein